VIRRASPLNALNGHQRKDAETQRREVRYPRDPASLRLRGLALDAGPKWLTFDVVSGA
jgi:hypothetical protein